MSADRCPTCDREGCNGARLLAEYRFAIGEDDVERASRALSEWTPLDCRPVDWRARAIAAESELAGASAAICDVSETIRAALAGNEGGMRAPYHGPLAAAVRYPSIVADLRRLDEVLTIGSPRAVAMRDDAAKWRRVEPLIERLREAATVARHDYATEDDTTVDHRVTGHELIDAVSELIAAVKEPS